MSAPTERGREHLRILGDVLLEHLISRDCTPQLGKE
jgi:hypothetical protein